jgi:hypothetical protein
MTGVPATAWGIGAACLLLIVQIGLLWRNLNVTRALAEAEERARRLAEALSLLTETTESGFRTMAAEIERLADAAGRPRPKRVNVGRMVAQARRGRTVPEIAAETGVSEGEVALRLHLADQRAGRATAAWQVPAGSGDARHGAV